MHFNMLIRDKRYLRVSQKTKDKRQLMGVEIQWSKMGGENMGYKKSRWSRIVTLLMSLEGVTKDKRQPMGKGETAV